MKDVTRICEVCGSRPTARLMDSVAVCTQCMLRDASLNGGRVKDYSYLKKKKNAEGKMK